MLLPTHIRVFVSMKKTILKRTSLIILSTLFLITNAYADVYEKEQVNQSNVCLTSSIISSVVPDVSFVSNQQKDSYPTNLSVRYCAARFVESNDGNYWRFNLYNYWDGEYLMYPDVYIGVKPFSSTAIAGTYSEFYFIENYYGENLKTDAVETSSLVVTYVSEGKYHFSMNFLGDNGKEYVLDATVSTYAYNANTGEDITLIENPNDDNSSDNSNENEDDIPGDDGNGYSTAAVLDSIVMYTGENSVRSSLTEFIYNNKDVIISTISKQWNETSNQWKNQNKIDNIFDDNDNIIGSMASFWDVTLQNWKYSTQTLYVMDNEGHTIEILDMSWDDINNEWVNVKKVEDIYESNGHFLAKHTSLWENNEWVLDEILTHAYDSAGNEIGSLTQKRDIYTNEMVNSDKVEMIYEDSISIQTIYKWDITLNEWVYVQKLEKVRNSDDYVIKTITSRWDTNLSEWIFLTMMTTTFPNEHTTNYTNYYWLNEWVPSTQTSSEYDDKGDLIGSVNYMWDSNIQDWVLSGKSETLYDDNQNMLGSRTYSWYQEDWLLVSKMVYFYHEGMTTAIQEIQDGQQIMKILYNGQLLVKYNSDIYNLQGHKVQ